MMRGVGVGAGPVVGDEVVGNDVGWMGATVGSAVGSSIARLKVRSAPQLVPKTTNRQAAPTHLTTMRWTM